MVGSAIKGHVWAANQIAIKAIAKVWFMANHH
jgi:hypothetical protein